MPKPPYILGIETSCDETAVALVDAHGAVRANVVASQASLHARFGGVVPEVASRRHLEVCLPLVDSVLIDSGPVGWEDIEALAVTQGPGLVGCLLIGVETAKALAWRHEKPLIAVHHLEAHLQAPFLLPEAADAAHLLIEDGRAGPAIPFADDRPTDDAVGAQPDFPHVGLIISGGHTSLVRVEAPGRCRPLAQTRDDAVGEAYDKVARLLGLGYPGGPVIDRLAAEGDASRFAFTAPLWRRDTRDFSFSGLKTAVARAVDALTGGNGNAEPAAAPDTAAVRDLCASFQRVAVNTLLGKAFREAESASVRDLVIVGGVAANQGLRRAAAAGSPPGLRVWFPHLSLCTDNAAMIAGLAWHLRPLEPAAALGLNPSASLPFTPIG